MGLCLIGYRYSVYTRIARMALVVRGLEYETREVNPFEESPDPLLTRVSPFGRVPVLDHDGFQIYETAAITRYIARWFEGPDLVPADARAAARMQQVISIVDSYAYVPLVRQVFSHAVFRPLVGAPAEPELIEAGLIAAKPVLDALEAIADEGLVLGGETLSLADLHLAPMIGYFACAEKGRAMVEDCPALGDWWQKMSQHPAYAATEPGLATLATGE